MKTYIASSTPVKLVCYAPKLKNEVARASTTHGHGTLWPCAMTLQLSHARLKEKKKTQGSFAQCQQLCNACSEKRNKNTGTGLECLTFMKVLHVHHSSPVRVSKLFNMKQLLRCLLVISVAMHLKPGVSLSHFNSRYSDICGLEYDMWILMIHVDST